MDLKTDILCSLAAEINVRNHIATEDILFACTCLYKHVHACLHTYELVYAFLCIHVCMMN